MIDDNKSKEVAKAEEPKERVIADMTDDEEKIRYHYQHAQGSIQDIARVYRKSVEEVLHILGLDELSEVQTQGDLIDQSEAGPETRVNPLGNPAKAHYTTD